MDPAACRGLAGEAARRSIRLAGRGIGQTSHRKNDSLPEALVQVFGDRAGRRGERDLARGRLALLVTRVGPLQQRAGVVVTQPGEAHPQLIRDRHDMDDIRVDMGTTFSAPWP